MLTRPKLILGVGVALIAIAAAIYFARWRDPALASAGGHSGNFGQPIPVRAEAVQVGPMDVVIDALGTVTARNTAVVRARVDGQLVRIDFQEGRVVKAGALLAEIDPRPFQAALAQSQGQLARDQALLASAKSDLDRYQALLAQDSIAKQQVDDQAALARQYSGAVQTDHGAVANARLQLEWTRITAPIGGRVGLRQVDVGNMVHAADANGIVVLTQTVPINVVFAVPADRASEVARRWNAGETLVVDAYDRDGRTLLAHGKLESADNVVDSATSTVKLKALFDNADGALFPNQFVNARLTLATLEHQNIIPAAAVQSGSQGSFVYVVGADSKVSVRPVVLGASNVDKVAVSSGLRPGERVVTDGTDKLHDNAKVEAAIDAPQISTKHPHGSGQWRRRHTNSGDAGQ